MVSRARWFIFGACLIPGILGLACAGRSPAPGAGTGSDGTTRLEVINRSSADMEVYVLRGGQRVRLGLAPGNETTSYTLSPAQVAGVGPTYFEAIPRLGLARPIGSEPVLLRAGDVVTLNIPPP